MAVDVVESMRNIFIGAVGTDVLGDARAARNRFVFRKLSTATVDAVVGVPV